MSFPSSFTHESSTVLNSQEWQLGKEIRDGEVIMAPFLNVIQLLSIYWLALQISKL